MGQTTKMMPRYPFTPNHLQQLTYIIKKQRIVVIVDLIEKVPNVDIDSKMELEIRVVLFISNFKLWIVTSLNLKKDYNTWHDILESLSDKQRKSLQTSRWSSVSRRNARTKI